MKPSLCGLYKLCKAFYRRQCGSLGVKFFALRLYKLCSAFYRWQFGVKPSLFGLHKLCKAFYRRQFGCEAFALRSVRGLQCIL